MDYFRSHNIDPPSPYKNTNKPHSVGTKRLSELFLHYYKKGDYYSYGRILSIFIDKNRLASIGPPICSSIIIKKVTLIPPEPEKIPNRLYLPLPYWYTRTNNIPRKTYSGRQTLHGLE